ncbi:MAG TPA: class I SAM-dependent methyltransferase [Candidatus Deferrimicrobium sp.]|nr:class I SAM-dependent methyltransferase [Candidatus Deferrimicrobium sp.]
MKSGENKELKRPKGMEHLIDIFNSLQEFYLISAGIELKIFDFLEKKEVTAEDLAKNMNFEVELMKAWCNAATSCGYLILNHDKFTLSKWSKAFLLSTSPTYIGYLCKYTKILPEAYFNLEARFKGNRPLMEAQHALNSVESIAPLARLAVPILMQNIPILQKKCHILDLGCGLASYLINFALNNPELTGVGIDGGWIAAIVYEAKLNVKKHNLQDRIKIVLADVLELELNEKFDIIFMSGFLQAFKPENVILILKKVNNWLKPDGALILQEMLLEKGRLEPQSNALLNLFLHLETSQAGLFEYEQLEALLIEGKFSKIRRIDVVPQISHVIAQR